MEKDGADVPSVEDEKTVDERAVPRVPYMAAVRVGSTGTDAMESETEPHLATTASEDESGKLDQKSSTPLQEKSGAQDGEIQQEVMYMSQNGMALVRPVAPSAGTAQPSPQYVFYRPPTKRVYRKLEGWLWKRGANAVLAGWKRRYFSLKDNRLYYSPLLNSNPINYILLSSETRIEVPTQSDPRFPNGCFHIHTTYTRRVFVLAPEGDKSELERWVAGIREVLKLLVDRYSLHKDFIRKYILPPEETGTASSSSHAVEPSRAEAATSGGQIPNKAMTRLLVSQPSRSAPSDGKRQLLDMLIVDAHINMYDKHALAAARAGLYLEISLGTQSLRSWVHHNSESSPSMRYLYRNDTDASPINHKRSSIDSQPTILRSASSEALPDHDFPWAGFNCTFNEEGSGEGVLRQGQLRVALLQVGAMRAADILIAEQFVSMSDITQDEPQELVLDFYFTVDQSSPDAGSRTAVHPDSFKSVRYQKLQQSEIAQRGDAPHVMSDRTRQSTSATTSSADAGSPLNNRQRIVPLTMVATADLTTPQLIVAQPDDEGSAVASHHQQDLLSESTQSEMMLRLETGILPHREQSLLSTLSRSSMAHRSKAREPVCTITLKVHKRAGSHKSGLLHQRGIASTSVPMRLDTGDIVLFDNSHIMAYGTKFFTMSQWDHVAMVVRWWNNELKLLEATLEDGVEVYNFDERMEYLRTLSKVAVRQLSVKRTPEMIDGLYRFIDEVQGRPFQKNRISMVKAWSGLNTEEDFSSLFCSELTAAAYKRMGLTKDGGKTSNNYMPSCWAGKGRTEDARIPLKPEVRLERKVVFPKL